MSELMLRARLGAALLLPLVLLVACSGDESPPNRDASPRPSIVVGEPGGEVTTAESPAPATPIPTVTAAPTPSPTPAPTPPVAADGFSAQVLACQSISGSSCNGQLGTLPPGAGSFTALVRFTDANAGDTMNAVLTGPAGTIPGSAYTLQGGGDGYYYTTFPAGNLPPGTYTVTATRNGAAVGSTTFQRG